jgi:hypothetical protein
LKYWISKRLLPALTLLLAVWLSGSALRQAVIRPEMGSWMGFGIGYMNPVSEAKYIKKYFPTVRIGNSYDEGSYLLWTLWPDNRIFIDARQFPFKDWTDEYWKIFHSNVGYEYPARIEKFINKQQCDLWCVGFSSGAVTQWLFHSPDWQLAYYGISAAVFVRKGTPLPTGQVVYSPDIGTIRNMGDLQDLLYWTLMIKDWQAVEILFARMEEYFTSSAQRKEWGKWAAMARYVRREGLDIVLTPPEAKE